MLRTGEIILLREEQIGHLIQMISPGLIYQNPEMTVEALLGSEKFSYAKAEPENVEMGRAEEFAEFEL